MKQDKRCPLRLQCFPTQVCPLAIERLKALERINRNTSHFQESRMEGCPWAVSDKDSNYCFFKYIYENEGKEHPTIEISEKLLITQAAVYSGLNRAINRIKRSPLFRRFRKP
jgi:hypothetical protein